MSQTFYAGAGSKLAAGLQASYFNNSATTVDTKLNISSATFDPTVEKGSEETLLMSKIKNGSYLLSIGMEGSFDANLRPEMTPWLFKAVTQNATVDSSTEDYEKDGYTFEGWKNEDGELVLFYSDGTEVIANFFDEPYVYGDKTIPARDFIICK